MNDSSTALPQADAGEKTPAASGRASLARYRRARRKMKRLHLIATGIFRFIGNCLRYGLTTIGVIVGLGFIALLLREVTTEQTVIEPISVPKSLADQGLTPEVAARHLQDAMNALVLNALNSGGSKVQISYGKDLPDIVVPTVGMSLSTLAAYVRMFLHLSSRSAVSGEIVTSDKNASLVLRLNATEIYRSDQPVALGRLDGLWNAAAEAVLRHTSPYHLALCWYDNEPDKAVALAHYLISYYSPTDENVAWAHIILGRHHRDYLRVEKARDAYKAALNVAAISRWGPLKWMPLSLSFGGVPSYALVAQLGLGNILIDQGEYKAAIDVLNEAVRMDRSDASARHYLGTARMMLYPRNEATGDFAEANRLLKKAIHDADRQGGGKGEAQAHISLGYALQQQGGKGADDEFKRATELDADNLEARTAYCQVLFDEEQRGNGDLFYSNFDSCVSSLRKRTADVGSQMLLANFYLVKGKKPDAIEAILEALKNDRNRPALHAYLGNIYAQEEQWDQAVQELSLAIELAPEASVNHSDLGNVYYKKGDFAEAARRYSQAIEFNPSNARYHANLAATLKKQNLLRDAQKEYDQAFKLAGRSDTELNNLGSIFFDKDDFANAKRAQYAAIAIEARVAPYHDALAKTLRKLDETDAAIHEGEEAIKLEPKSASRHNDLGDRFYEKGDFTKAVDAYRTAAVIAPNNTTYHSDLARALQKLEQFDLAANEYRELIKLEPTNAGHHNALGNLFFTNKDFTKAAEAFREAIGLEPKNVVYRTELANTLQQSGQLDAAIEEYERTIELEPTAIRHNHLGSMFYKKQEFIKAAEAVEKAIAIDPNDAIYHANLGEASRELRKFDAAIKECKRAIELEPGNVNGHNCLGRALFESNDFAKAALAIREAIKLEPATAWKHHYLGMALSNLDPASGEALEEYRTAIGLDRSYAEAYYLLATALAGRGTNAERKEACQLYREGAKIAPSRPEFDDGIASTCE